MRSYFVATLLLIAGCAHVQHPVAKPATGAQAATQIIPVAQPATGISPIPAQYEDYYVGMIADSDDPTFAYRPGDLIVQTRPSHIRLGEDPTALRYAPATLAGMTNEHPEPTDTEIAAIAIRSQRTIAALTEEIDRLREPHPAAPAPMPGDRPSVEQSAHLLASAPPDHDGHLTVIEPNADNTITIDPNLLVPNQPQTDNPFVQLYQPPVSWRDVQILVSAAVPGPQPSAIIDNEPYGIGDLFRDMTVYRIESDRVYLKKDSFLLDCPVSERVLKLRLP